MEDVLKGDAGALFLFLYLLPGFLGAMVYDFLVERPSPTNLDRILEALVLTLVSSVVVHVGFGVPLVPDVKLTPNPSLVQVLNVFLNTSILYISLCAAGISILFAVLNNQGLTYSVLNGLRVTYKSGDADVWQDTFNKNRQYWIRLRFSDGRSLVGWPQYYSATGKPRELFLADATWWEPNAAGVPTPVDVAGPGVYISDFSTVRAIELLE